MKLRNIWLLLAIIGAVAPWFFLLSHWVDNPVSIAGFFAAAGANDVATAFASDLVVSSLVFWVFIFSRRPAGPNPWPFVVINLFIGLSCALPLYFWAAGRESEQSR